MTTLKGKRLINGKQFEVQRILARRKVDKLKDTKTEKARKLRHKHTRADKENPKTHLKYHP
jgi:hypothetical protein